MAQQNKFVPPALIVSALNKSHLDEVCIVARDAFREPIGRQEIIEMMKRRNVHGMVVSHQNCIIGFAIYERKKDCVTLLELVVADEFRRVGVATSMLKKITQCLITNRLKHIEAIVHQDQYEAQGMLRRYGFKAAGLTRRRDGDEWIFRYLNPEGT